MRITCNQCGQMMDTTTCIRFCDEEKKQEQMDKIATWIDNSKNFNVTDKLNNFRKEQGEI